EDGGVGGGGTQDGGVVEGEIEGEEKSSKCDDAQIAAAEARLAAIEEEGGQQDERGNQKAIEGRSGARDICPADEDGRPGNANDAHGEREIGGQAANTSRSGSGDGCFSGHGNSRSGIWEVSHRRAVRTGAALAALEARRIAATSAWS